MRRPILLALALGCGLVVCSAPGQEGKSPAAEREVRETTEALYRAFDRLDINVLARMMSDTYTTAVPGPAGPVVVSRAEQLGALRRHKAAAAPPAIERAWRDLTARVTGSTAVVTGFTGPKGKDGRPNPESFVTSVWVRSGPRWQVVHTQRAVAGPGGGETDRWNDVFRRGEGFNLKPNALLAAAVKGVKAGKALDVGMGQGRNSVYLATLGWDVTGMDPAEVGLAQARAAARAAKVRITPVLQTAEEFDWGENRWDLIAFIYSSVRGHMKQVRASLKPGGLVVVEGFHRDATRGRRIGRGVVFDTDELKALFKDFEIVRYEEPVAVADYGLEKVRLVRLVARKKP